MSENTSAKTENQCVAALGLVRCTAPALAGTDHCGQCAWPHNWEAHRAYLATLEGE